MLKTRRFGYDGKGQAVLRFEEDLERAWQSLGESELICEGFVPFDAECSIIAARGLDGETACWPLTRNLHRDGILAISLAPSFGAGDTPRPVLETGSVAARPNGSGGDRALGNYVEHLTIDVGRYVAGITTFATLFDDMPTETERPEGVIVTLGGQTPKGADACNELTFVFLRAAARLMLPEPKINVRFHQGSPPELLRACCRVMATGLNTVALYNDDVAIPALLRLGIPIEDARDYCNDGCQELLVGGRSFSRFAVHDALTALRETVLSQACSGIICGSWTPQPQQIRTCRPPSSSWNSPQRFI